MKILSPIWLIFLGSTSGQFSDCGVFVSSNGVLDGVGIFASKNYTKGQAIERCLAFKVPEEITIDNILDHYVYGHTEENGIYYADIVLGHAMIFNHHTNASVAITEQHKVFSPRQPTGVKDVHDFVVFATKDITAGQEMYSSYGDKEWFHERNIPLVAIPATQQTVQHAHGLSGCPLGLTDVYNGKVYAKQPIAKGTIIEIARGLIFSAQITAGFSVQDYVWWSTSGRMDGNSTVDRVMLLLGNGALYRGRNDTEIPNVEYGWHKYSGSTDRVSVHLSSSGEAEDVVCSDKMLVRFTAMKDILVNEELIITLFDSRHSARPMKRLARLPGFCF